MNNELRIEANVSASQTEQISSIASGIASEQATNAAPVPPAVTPDFTDPAKHRKE